MKQRFFLLAVLGFIPSVLSAQYYSRYGNQYYGNDYGYSGDYEYNDGTLYINGLPVDRSSLVRELGYDVAAEYNKARKNKFIGISLTASGPGICLVGAITLAYRSNVFSASDGDFKQMEDRGNAIRTAIGAVLLTGGVASLISGIVLWSKGSSSMKTIENEIYSSGYLSLTPSSSGIGLALNF